MINRICVAAQHSHLKLISYLAFLVFLPFLSGCLSMKATEAANKHTVEITLYNSADRIEKAAVIKDDQLCIFFEKDLTNSIQQSHFSLTIPLAQIQTNSQYHDNTINPTRGSVTFVPWENPPPATNAPNTGHLKLPAARFAQIGRY